MSIEEADQLFNTIQEKRVYKDNVFKYVDMNKVDALYVKWFANINWYVSNSSNQEDSELNDIREKEKIIEDCAKKLMHVRKAALNPANYDRHVEFDKEWLTGILAIALVIAYPFVWFMLVKIMYAISKSLGGNFDIFKMLFALLFALLIFGGIYLFFGLLGFTIAAASESISKISSYCMDKSKNKQFNKKVAFANQIALDIKKVASEVVEDYSTNFPEIMQLSDEFIKSSPYFKL